MIREKYNKLKDTQFTLFSLYYKKNIKKLRNLISLLFFLLPLIISLTGIEEYPVNQSDFEYSLFWIGFIQSFIYWGPIGSILLSYNIISSDFSNNTAPIIYSSISRRKYITSNAIFLLLHQLLYIIISCIVFSITGFILYERLVRIEVFMMGFTLITLLTIFYLSFAFILSSLLRNNIIALLIPLFYIMFEMFFINIDIELLSFKYYTTLFWESFSLYTIIGKIIINSATMQDFYIGIVVYISAPSILLLASIYGIKLIEIRTG